MSFLIKAQRVDFKHQIDSKTTLAGSSLDILPLSHFINDAEVVILLTILFEKC